MHTANCTLHTAKCTLHNAYFTRLTAHCTLHTALTECFPYFLPTPISCQLGATFLHDQVQFSDEQCIKLHSTHCIVHTAHYKFSTLMNEWLNASPLPPASSSKCQNLCQKLLLAGKTQWIVVKFKAFPILQMPALLGG